MTPLDVEALRIARAARGVQPGGVSSPGAALGDVVRSAVALLDVAGRPEGREIVALLDKAADVVGPGGLAALDRGDLAGAAEAVFDRARHRMGDYAVDVVRRRFERFEQAKRDRGGT